MDLKREGSFRVRGPSRAALPAIFRTWDFGMDLSMIPTLAFTRFDPNWEAGTLQVNNDFILKAYGSRIKYACWVFSTGIH